MNYENLKRDVRKELDERDMLSDDDYAIEGIADEVMHSMKNGNGHEWLFGEGFLEMELQRNRFISGQCSKIKRLSQRCGSLFFLGKISVPEIRHRCTK